MIGCSTGAKARIGCESACRRESGSFFGLPGLVQIARAAMVFMWMASPLPSPRGRGRNTQGRAQRWPVCGLHTPSGRAEKRRAWGGRAAKHARLRRLTRCRCLSGESEANKASSAAPPRARASQAAHSEAEGHGQWGRLSFAYFSLAEQRKVGRPPGRTPGRQRLHPQKAQPHSFATLPH